MTKKEKHEKLFLDFVAEQKALQASIPDKMTKKRKGRRVTARKFTPYTPLERGKHCAYLIPAPAQFPCDFCAEAEFNRTCSHIDNCMCYAYWGITRVSRLDIFRKEVPCSAPPAKCTTPSSGRARTSRASSAAPRCSTARTTSSATRRSK